MDETTKLLNERQKTHGDFDEFAELNQSLKRSCLNRMSDSIKDRQVEAVEMICNKLARIVTGDADFADHWDDIAGYAKLGKEGHKPEPVKQYNRKPDQTIREAYEEAEGQLSEEKKAELQRINEDLGLDDNSFRPEQKLYEVTYFYHAQGMDGPDKHSCGTVYAASKEEACKIVAYREASTEDSRDFHMGCLSATEVKDRVPDTFDETMSSGPTNPNFNKKGDYIEDSNV